MRPTIIDRYLLREIVQTWAAVTAVLVLILASNSLVHMLGKVVEGELGGVAVLPLFLVQVTTYFVTLIPLGLFLALLLAFGRLHADSEMAALGACGVGLRELYRPVVAVALVGALLTGALTAYASPWAERAGREIAARMAARSQLAAISPGRFHEPGNGVVLFAERKGEDGRLQEVFAVAEGEQGEQRIVRARMAKERSDAESAVRYLEFHDGYRYSAGPGRADLRAVEFERHGVRLPPRQFQPGGVDPDGMSMARLWQQGGPEAAAELQWRIALPLACFLLALAAVPLAHTTPRKGRYSKIAGALVVYRVYSNILVVTRDAVAEGEIPATLGMWWVHGLTLVAVALLIARHTGWRWTARVLLRRGVAG
jgi:lipopolysaccharide export system permease protein